MINLVILSVHDKSGMGHSSIKHDKKDCCWKYGSAVSTLIVALSSMLFRYICPSIMFSYCIFLYCNPEHKSELVGVLNLHFAALQNSRREISAWSTEGSRPTASIPGSLCCFSRSAPGSVNLETQFNLISVYVTYISVQLYALWANLSSVVGFCCEHPLSFSTCIFGY